MTRRIRYSFVDMQGVVAFAIETLKARSPVGSGGDPHPGLYRDSHLIFIDGHVVADASAWRPGQQINISNPVPYARKIETGKMKLSVPSNVYESASQIVAARFGNSVAVKFVYMPVRFGDVGAFAQFSRQMRQGRRMSEKARRDWLVRQPALQITER